VETAYQWVASFADWYNYRNRHSGIKFVTPYQRHNGDAAEICSHRAVVDEQAHHKQELAWINPSPAVIELDPDTLSIAG